MGYTLRAPRATALVPLVAIPVALFAADRLGLPGFPLFFIVAFGLIVLYQAWQRSLVLQVDARASSSAAACATSTATSGR